ncbi:unnamed protein product [marine sediment metagenome]|uniref:Uncharacterized protein n=1 Tax=marine sediment metagenome TaxID=412755 RepID=X1DF87_9ZZZZ
MSEIVPIQILGNRAIVSANEGKLVTYLDKFSSHGYISSLIEKDNVYAIGKVIYDLDKVPISKVQEVAQGIGDGKFECPVCTRLATQSVDNNGDGEPITKEPKKEEPVLKEKPSTPEPKEEVKEPELELDEVEIKELERERAIQKIVNAMDEILLMKMMR